MSYDPKNRPVFLGFEHDRTNPNRLSRGVLSVADQNQNLIPVVEQPPTLIQKIFGVLKVVAIVLAGLAGSVIAAQASGVAIPGWLLAASTAIVAIAAPLGIASPGLKASQPKIGPPSE